MEQSMVRRRPLGVTIISVVLAIEGIFELIVGAALIIGIFALGHTVNVHGHTTTGAVIDVAGGVLGGISLVIGLLTLIFAIGLWMLKRWAFWLTIIIEIISVIRHALGFVQPNHNTVTIIIGLILPVVILLYFLFDRDVRAAFRT